MNKLLKNMDVVANLLVALLTILPSLVPLINMPKYKIKNDTTANPLVCSDMQDSTVQTFITVLVIAIISAYFCYVVIIKAGYFFKTRDNFIYSMKVFMLSAIAGAISFIIPSLLTIYLANDANNDCYNALKTNYNVTAINTHFINYGLIYMLSLLPLHIIHTIQQLRYKDR